MVLDASKSFQIHPGLIGEFRSFCRRKGLNGDRLAEALLLSGMQLSPAERKKAMDLLASWEADHPRPAETVASPARTSSAAAAPKKAAPRLALEPPASNHGPADKVQSPPGQVGKKVTINVDGGARGNPGPAAAGVVIRDAGGKTIFSGGYFIGRATNNVAEYHGLINGLTQAKALGAQAVEVFSDSELMVFQMTGRYRVKNAGLLPLYQQARQLAGQFQQCSFAHVYREENAIADGLVNQAIDLRANVGDARQR